MTERMYYTDSYAAEFEATVLQVSATADGRSAAVLDRTAFYPTSGGQPFDTGTLGAARVVDVIDQEDGTILHVLEGTIETGPVRGAVDWARRFDHMQQHTGQHVLSAALDHLCHVRTVSFHLGTSSSSIDLAREVTPQEIARAEAEANRVVWEDRPVTIRFADEAEAARMPLRKESARRGRLRLIDVENFDLSACGGTHVARTGSIGIIAVAGAERFKGGTRLEFLCGARALAGYRALRASAANCVRLLSVLPEEVPESIARLQGEMRDSKRRIKELHEELAAFRADDLAASALPGDGFGVVIAALEGWDQSGLKQIASALASRPGLVSVLVTAAEPPAIVVSRSAGVAQDSGGILRSVVEKFGGKGGGRPELAQGGGLGASPADVVAFVRSLLVSGATAGA